MKISKILGIGLLAVISFQTMKAQKAMTPYDLEAWKRIITRSISNDGQWAAAVFSPWRGEADRNPDGRASASARAYRMFSGCGPV